MFTISISVAGPFIASKTIFGTTPRIGFERAKGTPILVIRTPIMFLFRIFCLLFFAEFVIIITSRHPGNTRRQLHEWFHHPYQENQSNNYNGHNRLPFLKYGKIGIIENLVRHFLGPFWSYSRQLNCRPQFLRYKM